MISLGRRLVLIEGEKNSLDKQTYGAIVGADYPELVLVPAGGKGTLTTFASALTGVLNKTMWGIDWFMLADGDAAAAMPDSSDAENRSGGRLRFLPRYHLENYFLDEDVLATVFAYLDEAPDSWLRDPVRLRATMRELASPLVSYGAALRVAHRMRTTVGNIDLMPKGCHDLDVTALALAFDARRAEERDRIDAALNQPDVADAVQSEFVRLNGSLAADDEVWKHELPGRPILRALAAKTTIDLGTLKRLYIKCGLVHAKNPFLDIRDIFREFAQF